jgi:hypothetical protein
LPAIESMKNATTDFDEIKLAGEGGRAQPASEAPC